MPPELMKRLESPFWRLLYQELSADLGAPSHVSLRVMFLKHLFSSSSVTLMLFVRVRPARGQKRVFIPFRNPFFTRFAPFV